MEILVGADDERMVRRLRTLLHSFDVAPLAPLVDTERSSPPDGDETSQTTDLGATPTPPCALLS